MSLRIGRVKKSLTLDYAENATVITDTTDQFANGILREVIISTPATVDSSATVVLVIKDRDGATIYTSSAVAANTKAVDLLTADEQLPLTGLETLQITYSASQTANRVCDVTLAIDRG